MGLVPDIEGIYRADLFEMAGRTASTPAVDAVLISHAHADHVDYISFLTSPNLPTYRNDWGLPLSAPKELTA